MGVLVITSHLTRGGTIGMIGAFQWAGVLEPILLCIVMEVNVHETGDIVRVLEIKATAADLETDVRLALRKLQSVTVLRGFRPGRVPLKMIRRIRTEEATQNIANNLVKEVFEDMVKENDEYALLGRPREIKRSYELDGDLQVLVEFHVVPQVELKNLTEQVLETPVAGEVTDSMIEFFIRKKISKYVANRPLEEGEKIGEGVVGMFDQVWYRLTEIDSTTGLVLFQGRNEVRSFDFGAAKYLDPDADEFRMAFTGRVVGEEVFIEDFMEDPLLIDPVGEEPYYQAEILEALRFEWPEVDDEWAGIISNGAVDTAEKLREWVREYLSDSFKERSKHILDLKFKERMFELHPFALPPSFVAEASEELRRELGEEMDPSALNDGYITYLRWQVLLGAIEGQVDLESSEEEASIPDNETKPESENKPIAAFESPHNNSLTEYLLKQFEVREIPVSEWQVMYVIANEL